MWVWRWQWVWVKKAYKGQKRHGHVHLLYHSQAKIDQENTGVKLSIALIVIVFFESSGTIESYL